MRTDLQPRLRESADDAFEVRGLAKIHRAAHGRTVGMTT
jgi:hypothetical protein